MRPVFLLLLCTLDAGTSFFQPLLFKLSTFAHSSGPAERRALVSFAGKAIKDRSSSSGDDVDHRDDDIIDDIISKDPMQWRFERARLEHQHAQRIVKRRRVFLPYVDACLFARSMGFASKAEWLEFVEWNKVGPYYTRDPEGYYGRQGTWRGWDHFLGLEQQRGGDPFTVTETSEHTDVD